ncbi:MAG TPA: N-acetyl-gamma-glutamyl-phosphate reductase, partial [Pyrinomonadaceae bacterium]|nr:N-acetyl-gamma-glutamyl-phosphate reductase [Pyrinomonadaceae bacterium]
MTDTGNNKIRVAIFGGSGYGGSELLRILLFHPHVEIVLVTANEHAGKAVSDVHRNLLGLTDLRFETAPEDLSSIEVDAAFFALPHGQALSLMPQLRQNVKVVDLSGDFRIDDPDTFKKFYKLDSDVEVQEKFVYGLTENNRERIRSARYIANPGCFATATLLALSPMVKSGLLSGKVVVDAKTGSSGSGAKAAANTHHPQRSNSFYAYKPFSHQHVPEIE